VPEPETGVGCKEVNQYAF